MFNLLQHRKPSKKEAVISILIVFFILGFPMIAIRDMVPHIPILLALICLIVYGRARGISFDKMQDSMAESVHTSMGAIYLFFFIGILVTALMISGAIPSLIYFGLDIISSKTFYLSSFLATAIIGIAIGSSLTTVATLGVALMSVSNAFGLNPAITAGAIVSGAFFGDKMSPLSDTTGIAASIVGIDLFDHIKNMMYTTIPAFIVSAIAFTLMSLGQEAASLDGIESFRSSILATGLVHPYSLLAFGVLILLSIRRIPAVLTLIYTSLASLLISKLHSSYSMGQLAKFFFDGFSMDGLSQDIGSLVSRGGISSMFFTMTIVILALSLGGLLFGLGIIPSILNSLNQVLDSPSRVSTCVVATALGVNLIVGEQYLSILLAGRTFKPIYDQLGLHPKNLSRTLEDSGTVINPLVPWGVCGAFSTSMLGVATLAYLPFAIFCYTSLILTVVVGLTGLTMTRSDVLP
ncbi:Na+/H+ antiporter NhaC [Peptostreptococcus stomatis]|uniref:Na+/H+ antiporter NhaC n=1 Tax=Peptostreptococcus stomatis DSM 17678 TaxID=596315 RepID=E0E2K0_9FIRM|nr:Na+/H+ antiporter NhaC [Peptostreptococcus stomatis]EFM64880.1 Na+/H+ antiporter NhaC [Peptostreptococcus stomatis DSM 17678]